MTTPLESALGDALRGEYAAIFAYAVVGPRLVGPARALALQYEAAHRTQRDSLLVTLTSPPAAEAIYALPFPVNDAPSAIALAVYIEDRCAVLWRAVVVASSGANRRSPLTVLTDTALRAAALRRAGGAVPGTVPFPGLTA
ncbi:MAG TPA: ferritin-like domain-containing protein [Micromonosporaceae bacterium]|jgi:hypothetical protein|nr:ferritin-like domain-containing protein [Micromonosporaceae bacterium]